ncbi:AAA family ATPase [Hyalangium minutum]|uniref:AAA family ATPase n=1 Tax=Hyalangium minutum TaxID=394096 RepID=UPI0009FF0096
MAARGQGKSRQGKQGRGTKAPKPAALPVYFLSLTLKDVRCFGPSQTLKLSNERGEPARWTVILGNNGMGKTTLLQSLTTFEPASSGPHYATKGFVHYGRLPWVPVRHQAKAAHFSAELSAGNWVPEEGSPKHQQRLEYSLTPEVLGSTSQTISEPFLNLVCYGYGATRRMGAGSLSALKETQPSDSLFLEDVPLRNAEEWLLQADYAASKPSPDQQAATTKRDRIRQLLIDLLPEVSDVRFAVPTAKVPAARVEVLTPYGWVAMRDLSLGYRTLIAWMVDLASRMFERYPNSPNPLAEPAVVLVDEIDLHLHPKWQRQLIGYLTDRFPQTQFIVTAHSPLVVQSATNANIVVLRRKGDHVVIDNDVESIRGWRVDQILTSDLFGLETARPPQIEEFLKERTALLSKPRLTREDEARLLELEAAIGPLPTGETHTEREALELIQRAAARLRNGPK